jgi:probable F420-dependent oxidoreductase
MSALPFRLGLVAGNVGPDCITTVRTVPQLAEELGFHSVWFTDHVIGLKIYRPVYRGEWAEALTAMTWAAATTSTIRIGVGVLVAPVRSAVYAAKVVATIDQLSGGRVDLGIGTGWAYREFEALGRAEIFDRRGAATDEALTVFQRCFEGGVFGFDGEFTSFKEIEFAPRPAQRPHPPYWIGGNSGRALRRAATWADVWHPARLTPRQMTELGGQLDDLAGRKVARSVRLAYTAETKDEVLSSIEDYADVGCEHVIIEIKADSTDQIAREAELLATRFRL